MNINIAYLKEYPQYLPLLAEWMFNTWGHYNPGSSFERAKLKLNEHLNTDSLPITFIALDDNIPVGTCSLRLNDGIRSDLAPWLGSLYVLPKFRGKGLGEKLIDAVVNKASIMDYQKLFLLAFDSTLPNWYKKLGWQLIGVDELNCHPVSVMEISLNRVPE
ncbi:MAG: GNAT family N-acetyltransferase [Candidatus Berkiellales bacterium]